MTLLQARLQVLCTIQFAFTVDRQYLPTAVRGLVARCFKVSEICLNTCCKEQLCVFP